MATRPAALTFARLLALASALSACAGDSGTSATAGLSASMGSLNTGLPPGTLTDSDSAGTDSDSDSTSGDAGTESASGTSTSAGVSESDSASDATTDDPTTTTTDPTTTTTTGTTGDSTSGGEENCKTQLGVVIRDFSSAHPDFETFTGDNATTGLVKQLLGPDKKPAYAHPGGTSQTTGPAQFAHWYNDTPGINQPFVFELPLTESQPGVFTFNDPNFFPINDQGFGNEGNFANFHFTSEIHATFTYKGGELFTFTGDDDLWTFINGKLAIDLGGLHPPLSQTVDLDAMAGFLGIEVGGTYTMDIFHAERHTDQSNFRIDTSIQCFYPQ
ncbi:MAG: fibro-slime domain-containing protein [Nannocystis sp.]|nr:fibro-slime domain-containing protein [Nannocystis sp.]